MTDTDRQSFLSTLDFFSGCTERQLADVSHLAEERSFPAGAELCRQGDFENEVFVVLDGSAEVIVDGAVVGATTGGEIVGELSMLGSGRRSATLRAVEQLHVLVFKPDDIDSVLSADPSSAQRLTRHGPQAPDPE
jgi:CRP/FNR family cyclic AMP-dependent transcriptional regulator